MSDLKELVLHHGSLKFSALSMGEGPLVLCLHGFPDNLYSFRHQLPALAKAGYRAVSVALRGYEPQSQPEDGDYATGALATDIVAWLDDMGVRKAHLVGHDWGATIAYVAGASYPERFMSLTTMAVPHAGRFHNEAMRIPKQLRLSWYILFFQLRGISDALVERSNFAFIRMLWRHWSPNWTPERGALESVIATLGAPGVRKAALAYYRAALSLKNLTAAGRAANIFQVPIPTLAITGARDGCIDSGVFEQLIRSEDFPAGIRFERIADAGHFPHQEKPETVNQILLEWVGGQQPLRL